MTKCEEERWTPSLQSLKATLAKTQLLNDSRAPPAPTTISSSLLTFAFTSNSPPLCLHTSALAAMTGPSIISPD